MLANLPDRSAAVRVDVETCLEDCKGISVPAALGRRQLATDGRRGVWKGALAAEKDAEQDTQTPHLGVGRSVLLALEDLRAGKGHGAKEAVEVGRGLAHVGDDSRTKVDELDVEVAVDDAVLILDVTVVDAQPTEVVDGLDDLGKDPLSLVLGQARVLLDAFKEVTRRPALHRCRLR